VLAAPTTVGGFRHATSGVSIVAETGAMEPYISAPRNLPQVRPDERIGDQERGWACEQLSAAFALGRLSDEELEDRLARAMNARTRLEVQVLTRDLGPHAAPSSPQPSSRPSRGTPSWSGSDVLAVILLIGCALSISAIMLLVAGTSPVYFFCAVVGGTLAFVAGVSATQLVHRWAGRTRASLQTGG
jgi:hypothetical protein